jgi:hypothetical protein
MTSPTTTTTTPTTTTPEAMTMTTRTAAQIADTIARLSAAQAETEATIASLNARIASRGAPEADPLALADRLLGSTAPVDSLAEELRAALTRAAQLAQAIRTARTEHASAQRAEGRAILEAAAPERRAARSAVLKAADALADALAAADALNDRLAVAGADLEIGPRGLGSRDRSDRWSIAATAAEIREFIASEYRENARAKLVSAAPSSKLVRVRLLAPVAGAQAGAVVDLPEHIAALEIFDNHAVQTAEPLQDAPRPAGAPHCW